jgi:hypothetical protein
MDGEPHAPKPSRPHRRTGTKAAGGPRETGTDGTGTGAPGLSGTDLTLADLKGDLANRRLHTPRGAKMLQESIEQVGAARSIVIDEDNVILAGNGVVEAAGEAGLSKVLVVETDGKTVVAVRRSGLSTEEKRALALYDNRTGELSKWDADQLMDDRLHKLPLRPFFDEAELKKHMREQSAKEAVVKELDTSGVHDKFWIAIRGPLQSQAVALDKLKAVMAEVEGVEVELGLVQDQPTAKEDDW